MKIKQTNKQHLKKFKSLNLKEFSSFNKNESNDKKETSKV